MIELAFSSQRKSTILAISSILTNFLVAWLLRITSLNTVSSLTPLILAVSAIWFVTNGVLTYPGQIAWVQLLNNVLNYAMVRF